MKSRGEGLLREEWYSICSVHHDYNEDCNMCNCGNWINVEKQKEEGELFDRDPDEWRRIHSHDKLEFFDFKTGEKANPFPNLR
jgi:hypothetical protein